MNDELPRPYADEPPASAEPLSALQLIRTRHLALVGTVLLTGVTMVAYPLVISAMIEDVVSSYLDPASFTLFDLLVNVLSVLATVVPLVGVAVLVQRRVIVGRVLALLAASMVVMTAQGFAYSFLPIRSLISGRAATWIFSFGFNLLTLLAIGVLAIVLFPPVVGRNNLRAGVLASVALELLSSVPSWFESLGGGLVVWVAVLVAPFLAVGWAIAVLVTSPAVASGWSEIPAELQRQDP